MFIEERRAWSTYLLPLVGMSNRKNNCLGRLQVLEAAPLILVGQDTCAVCVTLLAHYWPPRESAWHLGQHMRSTARIECICSDVSHGIYFTCFYGLICHLIVVSIANWSYYEPFASKILMISRNNSIACGSRALSPACMSIWHKIGHADLQ